MAYVHVHVVYKAQKYMCYECYFRGMLMHEQILKKDQLSNETQRLFGIVGKISVVYEMKPRISK